MYTLHNLSFPEFISQLQELLNEGLIIKKSIRNLEEDDLIKEAGDWEYKVNCFLYQNISPEDNGLIEIFGKIDNDLLYFGGPKERKAEELSFQIINLEYIRDLSKMIDSLILNTSQNPKMQTAQEKLDLVLEKLNLISGGTFFSVEHIMHFNDIAFKDGEPYEISELLEQKGYVKKKDLYRGDRIRINIKGAAYIERKLKINTKKATNSQKSVDNKVDLIIEQLKRLGYGQEIIFEELEELKGLNKKLNKKNWKQVLKGKLVDLAVSQVINKDTVNLIYEQLVGEPLKLLGK